jgi:hypothetical protein
MIAILDTVYAVKAAEWNRFLVERDYHIAEFKKELALFKTQYALGKITQRTYLSEERRLKTKWGLRV